MGSKYVFCFKFPGVCFCQELAKLNDIWLSYRKNKKGDVFFLRHSVVCIVLWCLTAKNNSRLEACLLVQHHQQRHRQAHMIRWDLISFCIIACLTALSRLTRTVMLVQLSRQTSTIWMKTLILLYMYIPTKLDRVLCRYAVSYTHLTLPTKRIV